MAGIERRAVELPIASVTLLEDRAVVVRRGPVTLAAADERVVVEKVAPVVADKTVSVRVVEGSGVRVIDARVKRRAVVRLRDAEGAATAEAPADLAALRTDLGRQRDDLELALDRRRAEHDPLARQAAALDQVAQLTLTDLAIDATWGVEIDAERARLVDDIAAEERALPARIVELEREIDRQTRTIARLDARIAAVDGPDAEERADLEVDLAGAAGASCELRVEYVVPGACWRPWHTARMDGDARVEVSTDACVWQATGEDWRDVELQFSTERASLGALPPRLASDVLRATRKTELVVQVREQEIDTAGLGGEGGKRAAAELPGIDDGGQPVTLRAADRSSVPSDGRPYRVRLSTFTSEAQTELVSTPELAPAVLLKSTQHNRGTGPLLAGPVDLVRSSGLVGRTSILFIAAGEKFELGWGPEADLRISRSVEELDEKSRLLGSRTERDTIVRLRLSNLGATSRKISITERIPVSELEKIKVEVDLDHTTARRRPDEHGFLRWTVDLPAYGHDTIDLRWQLRK
ncbi:MAG TPA: mucoidy inhibitor MuiA family protein [Kofleriaceae bacterium]|nr:mucoidy inhibitor MuiA family protein [Kofleriaceae bacterium]